MKIKISGLRNCPHCGVDLLGVPIPKKDRDECYSGNTHFKREIGIYSEKLDGMVCYRCPDCGGEWDRRDGGS